MAELDSTTGVVALAAAAVAALALLIALTIALRLRKVRAAQRVVLGDGERRDLVAHADDLESAFVELRGEVEQIASSLSERAAFAERRLEGTLSHAAVVRYDAYNEMSGRQSSSVALLDDHRNGIVFSSILHREQARLYAKPVRDGQSDIGLSPEEQQAVDEAFGPGPESPPDEDGS